MTRFRQLLTDLAAAFERFAHPESFQARTHRVCCGHKRVLIVAHNFPQAREHARVNGLKDWAYVRSWEHLAGYTAERVQLIKLPGWDEASRERHDWAFRDKLRWLEAEIARAANEHS